MLSIRYCLEPEVKVAGSQVTRSVQLFQLTLLQEKQKAHKPRLQGDVELSAMPGLCSASSG